MERSGIWKSTEKRWSIWVAEQRISELAMRVTLRDVGRVFNGLRREDPIVLIGNSDGKGRGVAPSHFDELESKHDVVMNRHCPLVADCRPSCERANDPQRRIQVTSIGLAVSLLEVSPRLRRINKGIARPYFVGR